MDFDPRDYDRDYDRHGIDQNRGGASHAYHRDDDWGQPERG